jgi:hypothetical protein
MFFVELKPASNNKDIFNVEYIQQCKIKFEPSRYKKDIAQCANCQRYRHTKHYCHLKPRCVKCAGDHLNQYHQKERSSDVTCVICGGNHPANYKRCTVYKDLQKKTYRPLRRYTLLPHKSNKLYTQPGVSYAQVTKQEFQATTNIEQEPHIKQSHQQTSDMKELQNMMKSLFEQMGTIINLLTTLKNRI